MKKNLLKHSFFKDKELQKILLIMKNSMLIFLITALHTSASVFSHGQSFSLTANNKTVREVFRQIEDETSYRFFYNEEFSELSKSVSFEVHDYKISDLMDIIFSSSKVTYRILENDLVVITPDRSLQDQTVTGTVADSRTGETIPGVSVVIRGTTTGTTTNQDGIYTLSNVPEDAVLVFSYVGMIAREIPVEKRNEIHVTLEPDVIGIEEVVAIGYGTMRRSDLTGSVVRADIESFRDSPNNSIMQSLHGSVPGLSVGQVNQAGQEPDILIRGQSSLSGELSPLIVIDGVIFRGNLIDLNPNDIESIDILKDASSAAIYGSQASNGVVLITTTKSGGIDGKPTFNYSGSYSFQNPVKELTAGGPEHFIQKTDESDIFRSRIAESGYLERNPSWDPSTNMKTSEEIAAYNQGRSVSWFDLLTNDNMYTQNHNISMANSTASNNYLMSLGYTDQLGYMLNEGYERLNARINIDNVITDWLKIGAQTFMTTSEYMGQSANPNHRYFSPFATSHDENGELVQLVGGNTVNPLIQTDADYLDKRLNFFGNIYADVDIPFIEGLTYRLNFANNYRTTSDYYFRSYASNWEGEGSKREGIGYDWSSDNILSYKRRFNDVHNIDVTLVYGAEKRSFNFTGATSSVFSTNELGYNRLQTGSADLQETTSGAWEESSLYNMARIFYGYNNRYLLTGTIRRDGFSGFSDENKFGLFPSISIAWVVAEESFMENLEWLDHMKLRASYGSIGNRTIGRYQTLATVSGGYNYITASESPVFTQSISGLASPNLKWETTTGINLGVDFGIARRVFGSIDYYNNNTTDLLYEVDIPGISRFLNFPDNLGRLHNEGLELSLTSINIRRQNFEWSSTVNFSRNRNTLKELLGFDIDGDGKEDDLVSEGLFIGESIDAIYDYEVDGKWQVADDIPSGYDLGAHKVVDLNNDGVIDADDKSILGYRDPAYTFSIQNSVTYGSWTVRLFINSIQGGNNRYMQADNLYGLQILNQENHFNSSFPVGLDYWTPANPNAKYQKPNINVSDGLAGTLYSQRNFIRLQDISLSYDFPRDLIGRLQISNLRMYASGKNIITLTKWDGWDPETGQGIVRGGRPVIKSYTLGINIEF